MVIEVDGGQHYESDKAVFKDAQRDKYLESLGLTVLRFNNIEVLQNIEGVLDKIAGVTRSTQSSHFSLSEGEG